MKKSDTRTVNAIRNSVFGVGGQFLAMVAKFATRTVFVKLLSEEYLGLGGLFSNILSLLALSELGIGATLTFFMYKPCADGDIERLKSLSLFYKKIYNSIGLIVLAIGCGLTPFLPHLIKEMPEMRGISLYYILYVINSSATYFFAYKRSILLCYQKSYLTSITDTITNIAVKLLQIVVLILFRSYLLFLIIQILCTVAGNFVISYMTDKRYPFTKDKKVGKLSKGDRTEIFKKSLAMLSHNVGHVVVMTTDDLIISKILGLSVVGIYSNYYLLVSSVKVLADKLTTSILPSIGNLVATKNEEDSEKIFLSLSLFTNWAYSFCAICMMVLLKDFITIWVGERYLFDDFITLVLCLDFLITGMRSVLHVYKSTTGTFYQDRFKPIAESVVNLTVSIMLTKFIGVAGVKLGTIISSVFIAVPVEIYVVYKYYFKKSCIRYALKEIGFVCLAFVAGGVTYYVASFVIGGVFVRLLVKAIICLFVPNIILFIALFRTNSFREITTRLLPMVKSLLKK